MSKMYMEIGEVIWQITFDFDGSNIRHSCGAGRLASSCYLTEVLPVLTNSASLSVIASLPASLR